MSSKAKSAMKRAVRSMSKGEFRLTTIDVVRALRAAAKSPASEDEIDEIAAAAENVLRHIADIAESGHRVGRDVKEATEWAGKALSDPFFSSVDEFKYNPHRR